MGEKFESGESKPAVAAGNTFEQGVLTIDQLLDLISTGDITAIGDDATTNELLANPQVKEAVKTAIGKAYQEMNMERLRLLVERCKPSYQEHAKAASETLVDVLDTDTPHGARMLMWLKDYPGVFSSEVLNAAIMALGRELNAGRVAVVADILEALQMASKEEGRDYRARFAIGDRLKNFLTSTEGNDALQKGLLEALLVDAPTQRLVSFMKPADVRSVKTEVIKIRMQECLDRGDVEQSLLIYHQSHDVHYDAAEAIFRRAILEHIERGSVEQAMEIFTRVKRDFLSSKFIRSPEVFDAAAKSIGTALRDGDVDKAASIRNQLCVPDSYVAIAVKQQVVEALSSGDYESALRIWQKMQIHSDEPEEINEQTKPALLKVLTFGDENKVQQFYRVFYVPRELCVQRDVQTLVVRMLENNISQMNNSRSMMDLIKKLQLQNDFVTEKIRAQAASLIAQEIDLGIYQMERVREAVDFFGISQAQLDVMAQKAIQNTLVNGVSLQRALNIAGDFGISEQRVRDMTIGETVICFRGGNVERAFFLMDFMQIAPDDVSDDIDDVYRERALEQMLTGNQGILVLRFMDAFPPSGETIRKPSIHQAALELFEKNIQFKHENAMQIAERFALPDAELKAIGYRVLYDMLAQGHGRWTHPLIQNLHLTKVNAFEVLGTHDSIRIFFDETVPRTIRYASETYAGGVTFDHQRSRLTHHLSPDEYRRCIERNPALRDDTDPEQVFDALVDLPQEGEEGGEIVRTMRAFADMLGKETALRFANRPDLSRHDAFMGFGALHAFMEINGLDGKLQAKKHLRDLLVQVMRDDQNYATGTANREWNRVIGQLAHNSIEAILTQAEATNIPGLQGRVARLRATRFNPFRSWRGLRDCAEIASLLERREVLEIFATGTLSPNVQAFGETLLQHPTIDLEALTEFLIRPEDFFSRDASYVDYDHQRAMSVLNLVDQRRFSLSAEGLRDTLVDGQFDALQELMPYSATFFLDQEGTNIGTEAYLRVAFLRAIGQRKQGIRGEAADPKALFHALKQFGRTIGRDMQVWLQNPSATDEPLLADQLKGMRDVLYGSHGVNPPISHEIRVRVGRKDDASVLAAMNDAASCMPFGDGKTNVYLWNPNCAFLVVERRTDDGWRTMAQSVVMKDLDIGHSARKAIDRIKMADPIHDVLNAESLKGMFVLTCDNIEPSASEISAGRMELIEHAYRAFLPEYLRTHAGEMRIDPTRVIIGKETYDTGRPTWGFETVDNTFLPATPISYLDNIGTVAYLFRTGVSSSETPVGSRGAVLPIRPSDALALAYTEGKSFDNPRLIVGLYRIQHFIVGQALSREIHHDPNLSFISRTTDGRPAAYIFAGLDRNVNPPEVYIADFAVDRSLQVGSARHAVKVLNTFLEAFMVHWKDGEEAIPDIVAEMREATSYQLLRRQGENMARKFGLTIRINEEGTSTRGDETMRHVRISIDRL